MTTKVCRGCRLAPHGFRFEHRETFFGILHGCCRASFNRLGHNVSLVALRLVSLGLRTRQSQVRGIFVEEQHAYRFWHRADSHTHRS